MATSEYLFDPQTWETPQTYDRNYAEPPKASGVYLIVRPVLKKQGGIKYKILYVGSAKDLNQRYQGHEVRRLLNEVYGYVQFYFKREENYREVEKFLIKEIQPKFNKQWR